MKFPISLLFLSLTVLSAAATAVNTIEGNSRDALVTTFGVVFFGYFFIEFLINPEFLRNKNEKPKRKK